MAAQVRSFPTHIPNATDIIFACVVEMEEAKRRRSSGGGVERVWEIQVQTN